MLIAQMYHMEGSPPDAVLYWALGALLAAVLLQSRPALAAAFVLIVVWSVWERMLERRRALGVPARVGRRRRGGGVDGLAAGPASRRDQPADLAGPARLLRAGPACTLAGRADRHGHSPVRGRGRARHRPPSVGRACAVRLWRSRSPSRALFIAQFIDDYSFFDNQRARSVGRLLLLAILTLAGLLAAMYWALQTGNRGALWIGYAAFAAEDLTPSTGARSARCSTRRCSSWWRRSW